MTQKQSKNSAKDNARKARLAAALKANLKRRKAPAKAAELSSAPVGGETAQMPSTKSRQD